MHANFHPKMMKCGAVQVGSQVVLQLPPVFFSRWLAGFDRLRREPVHDLTVVNASGQDKVAVAEVLVRIATDDPPQQTGRTCRQCYLARSSDDEPSRRHGRAARYPHT